MEEELQEKGILLTFGGIPQCWGTASAPSTFVRVCVCVRVVAFPFGETQAAGRAALSLSQSERRVVDLILSYKVKCRMELRG